MISRWAFGDAVWSLWHQRWRNLMWFLVRLAPVRFFCRGRSPYRLAAGDPITVINLGSPNAIFIGVWNTNPARFYWSTTYGDSSLFADEGVTWIRGHFADGSPEIRALQTAHALRTAA